MQQTWLGVIDRYEKVKCDSASSSASMQAMQQLCRHIASSPLASGLCVKASMFDLRITQTPSEKYFDGPYLSVSPQLDGRIEFRYVDTLVKANQWHRTVDAADVIPRLLTFLDQLRWFPSEMLQG